MASMVNLVGTSFSYGSSSLEGRMKKIHDRRGANRFEILSPPSMRQDQKQRRSVVVKAETINPEIRKTEEKVVDSVVVEELAKPLTAYCRCWRSGTFPLCDGSHVKHNKATGDNVGPLLLKKQK